MSDSWESIKRLIRFPAFWLSALFLIYISIQSFNPSIIVVRGEAGWWVEARPAAIANWLPSGVKADFSQMNAFRVLEFFAASFLLMWGMWIGLSRRTSALIILWTLILSGSLMGFVAILQHLTGAEKVLGLYVSANEHFWGSFFYRNQGAAYLNLIMVAAAFLYFYYSKRAEVHGHQGGPHMLLFILIALTGVSVATALSRGGIIFGSVILCGFMTLVFLQKLMHFFKDRGSWKIAAFTGLLFVLAGVALATQVDTDAIQERFGDVEATVENADEDARYLSSKATWDMAQDNLWLGWGAGSFRYIFPIYQQKYPELLYTRYHKKRGWIGRKVYHYAHNDIFQFLAEYGVIGCAFLVGSLCCGMYQVLAGVGHNFPAACIILVGLIAALGHAFFDFILNSPAYWIAFVGLLTLASKLFSLTRHYSKKYTS
ncbi:MAG: O-antigen ligase family protein [Lentimonas sp.]